MIVKLGTPVEGIISEVLIDRGDAVEQGQVVARLESKVEGAMSKLAAAKSLDDSAIKSAEARHNFLLKKVERLESLLAKSVGSKADVEEAQAEAEVSRQEMNQALTNQNLARLDQERADAVLDQRTIRSPIDGIVTEVLMSPGEYRNGQSQLATLAKTDLLHVEVFVPNDVFGKIQRGSTATILPEQPVGGRYEAVVTTVDEVLDAKSGTFGVRLDLPNPQHEIPAGLSCRVVFPGT